MKINNFPIVKSDNYSIVFIFDIVSTYRSYVPIQASGGEVIRHLIVVGVFASVTAFQHCPISLVTSVVFILSGKRITVPLLSLGLDPDIKHYKKKSN
jgi:hypothetical protein